MKNLGYPVAIASMTRFSPSSYPTLSRHVGRETEMACGVKGGTVWPSVEGEPWLAAGMGFDIDIRCLLVVSARVKMSYALSIVCR
jgi:hypothetical protein